VVIGACLQTGKGEKAELPEGIFLPAVRIPKAETSTEITARRSFMKPKNRSTNSYSHS